MSCCIVASPLNISLVDRSSPNSSLKAQVSAYEPPTAPSTLRVYQFRHSRLGSRGPATKWQEHGERCYSVWLQKGNGNVGTLPTRPHIRRKMKTLLLATILIGLLVVAIIGAARIWTGSGDVEISTAGIIAMVLGVIVTLAMGGGLMYLVFLSNRSGHDDKVGR